MRTKLAHEDPVSLNGTADLIKWMRNTGEKKLYLTVHPERWSVNLGEWLVWSFLDFGMNVGKLFLRRNKA
jgi:hypothetical protein